MLKLRLDRLGKLEMFALHGKSQPGEGRDLPAAGNATARPSAVRAWLTVMPYPFWIATDASRSKVRAT
jgi:hypothetical protein